MWISRKHLIELNGVLEIINGLNMHSLSLPFSPFLSVCLSISVCKSLCLCPSVSVCLAICVCVSVFVFLFVFLPIKLCTPPSFSGVDIICRVSEWHDRQQCNIDAYMYYRLYTYTYNVYSIFNYNIIIWTVINRYLYNISRSMNCSISSPHVYCIRTSMRCYQFDWLVQLLWRRYIYKLLCLHQLQAAC